MVVQSKSAFKSESTLEIYFKKFRDQIVGKDQEFKTPFGNKKIIYADWTASGRMYSPIEDRLNQHIYPYVANTHTDTKGRVSTKYRMGNPTRELIAAGYRAKQLGL